MYRIIKATRRNYSNKHIPAALLLGCLSWFVAACQQAEIPQPEIPEEPHIDDIVLDAIGSLGLDRMALSVPRLDKPIATPARLALVDEMMQNPLGMASLSKNLTRLDPDQPVGDQLAEIMRLLDLDPEIIVTDPGDAPGQFSPGNMPLPLQEIVTRIIQYRSDMPASLWPRQNTPFPSRQQLEQLISTRKDTLKARLVSPGQYWPGDSEFDVQPIAAVAVALARYLETKLPDLETNAAQYPPGVWETPYGQVRLAGSADDHHSGSYLLLIDPGGNDVYENLNPVTAAGSISIVMDLSGDDKISWDTSPGPGSGVLGLGIWIDSAGNDHYEGSNLGAGAGMFGAGLLWDRSGDDVYISGSLSQGAGQYGVGILIDESGSDQYIAEAAAQGFGGPGGYGIHIDMAGDDHYECKEIIPDTVTERNKRHGRVHFKSLCQGFGYGLRPAVSGGAGLLLDMAGDDEYVADMFAQGSATWFGFGILTDAKGSDSYHAFEHCQGESLHAGAGFLGDWAGNDRYQAYEHCQGTGVDGSVGFLLDAQGNDEYRSNRESQGAGVKPNGVGLLVELGGNDLYEASSSAQGVSVLPRNFPSTLQPLGVLLDLSGNDRYLYPGHEPPSAKGRVRNRLGLAIDYPSR